MKKGFTLSEILITLTIVGIVAAISIPSIIQHTQKKEYVEKLKKAHSTLSQAVIKIAINEGYPVGDFTFMQKDDFFNHFSKTVNTNKICIQNNNECFTIGEIKYLNGNVWNESDYENSLITLDGISYNWKDGEYVCSYGLSSSDTKNCIGRFVIDVNATRKPNKMGHDIFFFAVVNGKGIVPVGSGNQSGDCHSGSYGRSCAAKVLKEGKISY